MYLFTDMHLILTIFLPPPPYNAYLQPNVVQNMTEFKRSLPLFPLVKPHINFMAAKLWRISSGKELQVESVLGWRQWEKRNEEIIIRTNGPIVVWLPDSF